MSSGLNNVFGWIGKKFFFTNKIRAVFNKNVRISKSSTVNKSSFEPFVFVGAYSNIQNSQIGSYTSVGRFTNIYSSNIGKFCSISWNVTIGAPMHPLDHLSTHAFPYIKMFEIAEKDEKIRKQTRIGHDVWIGTGVIVMPGVTIGTGAVLGAGTIVTKDVPPYAIVVGNPGKVIRYRVKEEYIPELMKIKWWNLPANKLKELIDLFRKPLDEEVLKNITDKI